MTNKSGKKGDAVRLQINESDKLMVLFHSTWCPFCRRFLPFYEEYAKHDPEECLIVDIDNEPELCEEFCVEYYPTVIMFEKGKVFRRLDSQPGVGLNKKQLDSFTATQ